MIVLTTKLMVTRNLFIVAIKFLIVAILHLIIIIKNCVVIKMLIIHYHFHVYYQMLKIVTVSYLIITLFTIRHLIIDHNNKL